MPPWLARGVGGESADVAGTSSGRVAWPALRPGDQLRGRHPLARVAGAVGREAARRVRARRWRPAPHRRRRIRRRPARRRQRPCAGGARVRPACRVARACRHRRPARRSGGCRSLKRRAPPRVPQWRSLAALGRRQTGPLLAVHAPGGRAIKQWPVERFADAASVLATDIGASVVLTGGPGDEAVVERDGVASEGAWRADAARAGHNGPGRARGHAAPMPRAAHGRHRADAPGGRRGHARAGGLRAVDAVALRAAG